MVPKELHEFEKVSHLGGQTSCCGFGQGVRWSWIWSLIKWGILQRPLLQSVPRTRVIQNGCSRMFYICVYEPCIKIQHSFCTVNEISTSLSIARSNVSGKLLKSISLTSISVEKSIEKKISKLQVPRPMLALPCCKESCFDLEIWKQPHGKVWQWSCQEWQHFSLPLFHSPSTSELQRMLVAYGAALYKRDGVHAMFPASHGPCQCEENGS